MCIRDRFILETNLTNYIIIDDDTSTVNLPFSMKEKLIITQFHEGFTEQKLTETIEII